MKYLYLLLSLFIIATIQAQTQDTLYVWKAGNLVIKQSVKPVDIDSITFKRPVVNIPRVTICNQVWATKNLDVTTYSDGTVIPQIDNQYFWATLTTGAWCYYANDTFGGTFYGKLYNWYAVAGIYNAASLNNPALRKNLAPIGWHVPTYAEWTTLITCLGGEYLAGNKMKEMDTSWFPNSSSATNSSGFTGRPGGYCTPDGLFFSQRYEGRWWSSSEYLATARSLVLYSTSPQAMIGVGSKREGYSVRCIKD